MSVQPSDSNGYCDPDDVARYFRTLEDDGFSMDSNPTERQVEEFILEATSRIEKETGHAFREKQVAEEYHDLDNTYYYRAGTPISLMKREIRDLDHAKGDRLEFYTGDEYEEWVSDDNYEQGRDNDYWINGPDGILYIYRRQFFFDRYQSVKVTYRYGKDDVPHDIQAATAKLTAANLIRTDLYGDLLPTGADLPSPNNMAESLEEQAMKAISNRKEVKTF